MNTRPLHCPPSRRLTFLGLIVLGFAVSHGRPFGPPAPAFATEPCTSPQPISVTVGYTPPKGRIFTGHAQADIQRSALSPIATTDGTLGGLTVYQLSLHYQVNLRSLTPPGYKTLCVQATALDIHIDTPRLEIFIPREYPRGSCEHQAVYDHEKEHVAILRQAVAAFAPELEDKLRNLPELTTLFSPQWALTAKDYLAAIEPRLRKLLEPFEQKLYAELAERNSALDSPANYQRITDQCQNWIPFRKNKG